MVSSLFPIFLVQRRNRIGRLTLNDSIHRTAFLAEPTIDAFSHVDIVSRCSSTTVLSLLGFDRNGGGRTDSFAELAGYAAFFACGVAAEGVLAAEARRYRTFFERIVDSVSGTKLIIETTYSDLSVV